MGRGARPDRGDRRGARVGARRRRLLRGGRPDRHPRRQARRSPGRHPAEARAHRAAGRRAQSLRLLLRRPCRRVRGGGPWWCQDGNAAGFLAPLPVALLRTRPELQALPEVLERLGIRTLGELAALPSRAVAERFGHPGLLALDLARGRDTPLEPRRPPEPVAERIDLPEAASGQQLERALELLVARLLARRERRGRTLRALAVSARFVAGGTWRLPRYAARRRAPTRRGFACCWRRGWPSCRRPPSRWRSRSSRSARRHATRARLIEDRRRPPRHASARRCARPARPPGRRPRCGCWRSTPSRGCPSGARCWRRSRRRARADAARLAHAWALPRPAAVSAGRGGAPAALGAVPVETVREDWVVEDRWWTGRPLRRRYFELVLATGATRSSSSTCAPAAGSSSAVSRAVTGRLFTRTSREARRTAAGSAGLAAGAVPRRRCCRGGALRQRTERPGVVDWARD